MSERKKGSVVAWISTGIAIAGLSLGVRGQWADLSRLSVDDATELARTIERIDARLGNIENDVAEVKTQTHNHRNETRRFHNCANGNFDAITMQGKPNRDCSNIGYEL